MEGQAPQIGTYQVLDIYSELGNGQTVIMADVIYKGPNWSDFDRIPRQLRLQGLFNKSSIGPKEEFKGANIGNLNHHLIIITNKIEDHENKKFSIEWEAYKPINYNDLVQEAMDRIADSFENQYDPMDTELHTIEMEELVFQQNQDEELGYEDHKENEFDDDGNVIL